MKTEKELHVPVLKVIKPTNDRFADTVDYGNYCLPEKLSQHDVDVAHELPQNGEEDSGADEGPPLFQEKSMSVIDFLQKLSSACDACGIHEGATLKLFSNT